MCQVKAAPQESPKLISLFFYLVSREVTVEDTSQKYSMDLRLLLGVAYGRTWFARWGYQFHSGSFDLTKEAYKSAIAQLSSFPLASLLDDATTATTGHDVRDLHRIVSTYSSPGCSTVRELLRQLLDLIKRKPQQPLLDPKPKKTAPEKKTKKHKEEFRDFDAVAAGLPSSWAVRRLKFAAEVIVDALIEHERMMTRQEVRDAARQTIGDTGLIDFVLKSLGDVVVGRHVVRRNTNPITHVLEFSIQELGDAGPEPGSVDPEPETKASPEEDLAAVYSTVSALLPDAARVVLDAKHWRKVFGLHDEFDDRLRFFVQWVPSAAQIEGLTRALPPAELVVLDPHVWRRKFVINKRIF